MLANYPIFQLLVNVLHAYVWIVDKLFWHTFLIRLDDDNVRGRTYIESSMDVDILVTLHIQNHIKMLLMKRCSSLSLQKYDNKRK